MELAGPDRPIEIEILAASEHVMIRPLLVELYLEEQPHFADHPQLSPAQVEAVVERVPTGFRGENVILAARDGQALTGFCWCVVFDPGTGLEGEVAELYVAQGSRGRGVGAALVRRALQLFEERGVTLGYVWTRPENKAAVRIYRKAGFKTNRQLVLTWYPGQG